MRVRCANTQDDWCPAKVAIISENGQSIGLRLQGMVRVGGGYIGGVLLVWPETGGKYGSVTGGLYEMETV